MNFCFILASGVGNRMGLKKPKQFVRMGEYPLICYSLKTVFGTKLFDKVYIGVSEQYIEEMEKIMNHYFPDNNISIVFGGEYRMETFYNILEVARGENVFSEDDCVCMMDANRPLLPQDIYMEGIRQLEKYKIVCLGRPVVDGICKVNQKNEIYEIPEKSMLYSFQTPEFFKIEDLLRIAPNIERINGRLGIAEIFLDNDIKPYVILSDDRSLKVTSPIDIKVFNAFLADNN